MLRLEYLSQVQGWDTTVFWADHFWFRFTLVNDIWNSQDFYGALHVLCPFTIFFIKIYSTEPTNVKKFSRDMLCNCSYYEVFREASPVSALCNSQRLSCNQVWHWKVFRTDDRKQLVSWIFHQVKCNLEQIKTWGVKIWSHWQIAVIRGIKLFGTCGWNKKKKK